MSASTIVSKALSTRSGKTAVTVGIGVSALLAATPASASVSASAYSSTGARVAYATGSGVSTLTGSAVKGTLYDTAAGDSRCARLYSRGYNYFLGYTSAQVEATVCSGGLVAYQTESYWTYGDKVQIKVCAGYITTTPTECSGWVTAG